MKNLLLHTAVFLGLIFSTWGQGLPEIRNILEQEDGHAVITKLIQDSPGVRQRELIAIIVKLVRDDLAKPPPPNKSSRLVCSSSYALIATGDEQAILDAFKDNLDNARPGELVNAVDALATCQDERAVAIIEDLARSRLGRLGETLIQTQDEDEGRAKNDLLGSFVQLLKGLAKSANPSGGVRAKVIRDEFAALYPTENGKLVLTAMDAELAKMIPSKFNPPDAPPSPKSASSPSAKTTQKQSAESKPSPTRSGEQTSSTPWSVIGILIAAASGLAWLLLKKRN